MNLWQKFMRKYFSLREGEALRVIFYYPGEEPTYLDDAYVTIYRNGVVEVEHRNEHVSTHSQNIEVLWRGKGLPAAGAQPRALSLVKGEQPQPENRV